MTAPAELVRRGLDAVGVDRLVCGVHDRMFPARVDEDTGAGSFASRGADDLVAWLAEAGVTDLQLGPAGRITEGNRSPFDGTAFARCESLLSPSRVLERGLLSVAERDALLGDLAIRGPGGPRSDLRASLAAGLALARAIGRSPAARDQEALARLRRAEGAWLDADAAFLLLATRYGTENSDDWPDHEAEAGARVTRFADPRAALDPRPHLAALRETERDHFDAHAAVQAELLAEHHEARARARRRGVSVFGDLQAGMSLADRYRARGLLLPAYAMGAPPSRTNPEGQPWGYPLLDPRTPEASAFFQTRIDKMLREYDGVRLDHPHALVCPWAYREGTEDPLSAVQRGARLFCSPAGSPPGDAHPALAAIAIARREQIDPTVPPHADGWVRDLDGDQEARYARRVDAIVASLRERGRGVDDIACEVLSTQPYPLGRVLARHGIGRFRVTQKTSIDDPRDVYHFERALPEDWVMVGTHDTPPIWALLPTWSRDGTAEARGRALAARLGGAEAPAIARWLEAYPSALGLLELAALFTTRARRVYVFVADWMGETTVYNRPGVVHEDNWTLRVPRDFVRVHDDRLRSAAAFDPLAALALALATRPEHRALAASLAASARAPLPALAAFSR